MALPDSAGSRPTTSASSPLPRLALEHYDPRPIRKVPIERWRDVFTRAPPPPNLAGPKQATIDDVVAALTRGSLPPHLHDLLQVLHDLGTAKGAHALNEGAVEIGLDRDDWPDAVEELAVEIWARARVDAQYQRLLIVAEVGLRERAAEAKYREYFGRTPRTIENPNADAPELQVLLVPWFRKEHMGGRVRVLLQPEDDRVVFCIFHGARRQYEATFDDDGEELIGFRPGVCDVVTYEPLDARLRITTRSKRVAEHYRRSFGTAFFDDEAFFSERPRYDLAPLAEALSTGSLPSPSDSSDIHSVNLVDCVWTVSDGIQHRIHGLGGRDCTQQALRAKFRIEEDRLTQATLAFTFRSAGRVERTEIVLRTGNEFDCRRPMRRDAIEEYLTRIRVRRHDPVTGGGSSPPLFLLGVHSAARWQAYLKDKVAQACDLELLRPMARSMVGSADEPQGDGADPVTQIEPGVEVLTLARNADEGDVRLIRADDVRGYVFDPRRLAELVRSELACESSLRDLAFPGGYDLGPVRLGSVTVRPFLVAGPGIAPPQAAIPSMESIAGPHARWIALLPPGSSPDTWMIAFPLRSLLPPYRVRGDIIRTLGIADQVNALERADGERLVVDTKRHEAWFDGVRLELSDGERALLEILARARHTISVPDLNEKLSPGATSGDVAKQRVRQFRKAVLTSFQREEKAPPADVETLVSVARKGAGYRLGVDPYVE